MSITQWLDLWPMASESVHLTFGIRSFRLQVRILRMKPQFILQNIGSQSKVRGWNPNSLTKCQNPEIKSEITRYATPEMVIHLFRMISFSSRVALFCPRCALCSFQYRTEDKKGSRPSCYRWRQHLSATSGHVTHPWTLSLFSSPLSRPPIPPSTNP